MMRIRKRYIVLALIAIGVGWWALAPTRVHFEDAAWARSWRNAKFASPGAIGTDAVGNVYLAGFCSDFGYSQSGGCTTWVFIPSPYSGFVMKFNNKGSIEWQHWWRQTQIDDFSMMEVTDSGTIYMAGRFSGSPDFDPGPGVHTLTAEGTYDFFILSLDDEGHFRWAKNLGCSSCPGSYSSLTGFMLDENNLLYVTGKFAGTLNFGDPAGSILQSEENETWFLAKFDSDGGIKWSRVLDPGEGWALADLQMGADNELYVGYLGHSMVEDVDYSWKLIKLNSEGIEISDLINVNLRITDYSVNQDGDIFMTGFSELPLVNDDTGLHSQDDGTDRYTACLFLTKFNSNGECEWVQTWKGYRRNPWPSLALDRESNVYVSGGFVGETDFDPGPEEEVRKANTFNYDPSGGYVGLVSSANPFICKFDSDGNFIWVRAVANNGTGGAIAVNNETLDVFVAGGLRGWSPNNGGAYLAKIEQ